MNQQPIPLRTRRVEPVRRLTAEPVRTAAPDTHMPHLTRPRLLQTLAAATAQPLTVVNAPAGSGKTVAVRDWAAEAEDQLVWVTVAEADLAGSGLWGLVMEELHHHGLRLAGPLPGPGSRAYDRVFLFSLATQLADRDRPLVVVVDAECPLPTPVGAGLHYLVQHAMGRLRLVLLTRDEPPLPMWRYRVAGDVSELRAPDLAFTETEARELLARHDVGLSRDAHAELMRRTRGWAVGLTLSARALAGAAEPDEAVTQVGGDTGAVADYLLAEVLDPHPPAVRRVLLRTSVVDLLRPGLVEALAGPQAPRTLSTLLGGNALLESVPAAPGCLRYHPMFRQLLRSRLEVEAPGDTTELDRTASSWLARNGVLEEAVFRETSSGRWRAAAGYVVEDLAVGELLREPADPGLVTRLADLPDAVPGAPAALVRAALALAAGDPPAAQEQLARVDTLLGNYATPPVRLARDLLRLRLEALSGEAAAVVRRATDLDRTLSLQDERRLAAHPDLTAMIAAARGSALVALGDLESAARVLSAQTTEVDRQRTAALVADCLGQAALVAAWRGELRRAVELAERAVASSDTPAAEVALAWVSAERYDFTGPRTRLLRAPNGSRPPGGPLARAMLALARCRAARARGHLDQALTELVDPRLNDLPGWLKERLRVEAAAVHLATGNHRKAATVVGRAGTELPEARLVLAQATMAAGGSPSGLEELAITPDAVTTRVTGGLVLAEALLDRGERRQATDALSRSLRLATPERLRRPFEEAPAPIRRLLVSQQELRGKNPWLVDRPHPAEAAQPAPEPPPIVEDLTEREREVLGLLANLLSTEEIAGTLFISVNTVRTHVRSILRKLGATRRNEAIRRARALGLLPAEPPHVGITRYG
ncbi:MAG TPA: LuxR C-terminal-related transcriptional regulator [Nocardioidaceae bacterium]|jgi:LuxR family maltose regulon positive regulatory protein|nr:LuxR C-terminal-related transcriptional regulator [Nocardioidaceae bacterium]